MAHRCARCLGGLCACNRCDAYQDYGCP